MKQDLLNGKWQFVGAESYKESSWQESPNFVEGMTWTFHPQYFSERQTLGNIEEYTPSENPINMSYSFNFILDELRVEIYTDKNNPSYSDPHVDKYQVLCDETLSPLQAKLSILNECGCPPPHFQYILQKVED